MLWDELIELFRAGGMVMPPLLFCCSLLSFALIRRFFTLRRGSRDKLPTLLATSETGKVSTPFLSMLEQMKKVGSKSELDLVLLKARITFTNLARLSAGIVLIAPLLGLLGTVSGMMETFAGLGDMSLFEQSGGIAGGISEALISTQMGLAVATPGLIIGRFLQRRESALLVELRQAAKAILQNLPAEKQENY